MQNRKNLIKICKKNNVSGEELQKRVMDYVGITYPESHYEIKLMIRELKNGK